jgi:hypothetical protein
MMAAAVAAQEQYPVAVEVVAPVSSSVNKGASVPEATLNDAPVVTIPLRSPVDEETYNAIKEEARDNPMAEEPNALDVLEESQGPVVPNLDVIIVTRFPGLTQSTAAGCGRRLVPPDPIVAKSDTHVLEATNSALRLFSPTGTILDTKDLNTFFNAPCGEGVLFDPKVYFDRNASNRRFYVVALQRIGDDSPDTGISRIWLAISRNPDPTTLDPASWCRYPLNGKDLAPDESSLFASWADYPGLGVGADKIVISSNQFTFECFPGDCGDGGSARLFTYALIRVLNKLVAADNASSCPGIPVFTLRPSRTFGDNTVSSLQPVQHYTSPTSGGSPVYLMNTITGSSNSYKVWRVGTSMRGLTLQGPVNVTGSFTYGIPPHALQMGSEVVLDTGDNRITQAAGIGDEISGVHSTVCNSRGGPNEACIPNPAMTSLPPVCT